jgi:hypothetical protein
VDKLLASEADELCVPLLTTGKVSEDVAEFHHESPLPITVLACSQFRVRPFILYDV